MKWLTLLLLCGNLYGQTFTLTTTNVYSIRFLDSIEFTNEMVICSFGQVINVDQYFQGVDIGAYQAPKNFMENRTIMTFNIQSIPLTISNNAIAKAILTVPLQNQMNGLPNGVIDIYPFYNVTQVTTNNWTKGTYYKSFPDVPSLQNIDVTSLVKSAKNSGYANLNLRMSTTTTNSSCVFVSPTWHTNKTSLVVTYSNIIPPDPPDPPPTYRPRPPQALQSS